MDKNQSSLSVSPFPAVAGEPLLAAALLLRPFGVAVAQPDLLAPPADEAR